MQTFDTLAALQETLAEGRRAAQTLGLVPTMGAFHDGHLSLMRRAKSENDRVLVTLFVNPTQFNDASDFDAYPRDPQRDMAMAEATGVDYLLTPTPEEMYPKGFDTVVTVRGLSGRLEGELRPGHLQGVATVVAKLLGIARADRAYFGEKDWQQLQTVKRMASDLNMGTEIIGVPTVREPDGLAMSSRNVRLTPEQRKAATVLSSALSDAQAIADTGVQDAYEIAAWVKQTIAVQPLARIEYAVVVDPETLQEIDTIENGGLAAVAAFFGSIRLIDNRLLSPIGGYGMRR